MVNYGEYIDPFSVRNLAIQLILPFADQYGGWNYYQAAALFDYVKENIKYVYDPIGFEYIANPAETVNVGAGDCEGQAILLASLCVSVGIPARLVYCSKPGSAHLLCQIDFGFSHMPDVSYYLKKYYLSNKLKMTPDGFNFQWDTAGRQWLMADTTICRYLGDIQPLVNNGYIAWGKDRTGWSWLSEIYLYYPNYP